MGNKYTVEAWDKHGLRLYNFKVVHRGQWLVLALYALWKASRKHPMAKLEVR